MDWLRYDLRAAARDLIRRPGLSAVIIGTLAFGLGVNAVAFSAVDALFFASTRIPHVEGAGWLFAGTRGNGTANASLRTWRHIRDNSATLDHLAAEGRLPIAIDRDGAPEQVWSLAVSGDYFSVMPVRAAAGRMLAPADETSPGVPVVISEKFWRDRFDARLDLSNQHLTIGSTEGAVVGVAPDDFQGPGGLYSPDVWIPIAALARLDIPGLLSDEDAQWLTLIGSPAEGASPAMIESEVQALLTSLAAGNADESAASPAPRFVPLLDGHPELSQGLPQIFAIVVIAMTLLLLVACFNVAGLTLARSLERRRDMAVRSALGASPWRLIRALLTESLLMALVASVVGLVLVQWAETLLGFFSLPAPIPQRLHFAVSGRLLGLLGILVVFATTLPVIVPAWQVRRRDALASAGLSSRGETAGGGGARRLFVRLQVAGSMLFVCLGLIVIQSFTRALAFDPGFDPDRIAVLNVMPAIAGYTPEESRDVTARLIDRLDADPALTAVAAADRIPFYVGYPDARAVSPDAAPCEPSACDQSVNYEVTGGFFDAMGVRLVAGRTFDERAGADASAVVVNETAAARFWPNGSAIGESFREGPDRIPRTVVGIVSDFTQRGLDEPPQAIVYRPLTDDALARPVTIIARGTGAASAIVPVMRQTVSAVDDALPPGLVQTMRERMALPLWFPRVIAGFFGFCGVLAMVLATVGLFGTAWYAVSRRTREFGVRLAVGAAPGDVRSLVVKEGVRLALPGVLLGLGAAVAVILLGRSMLTGVDPGSPGIYLAAAVLQLSAIVLANWWPARRASSVDPLRALTTD